MKKLLIFLSVIAVVFCLVLAGAYYLVPKDKIKEMAIARISEQLKRNITIESLDITPFPLSVNLAGVKVGEKGDSENFISCQSLSLKLSISALIQKKIQVTELLFQNPDIRLKKLQDGKYNFSDLLGELPHQQLALCSLTASAGDFSLNFSDIRIRKGRVTYQDSGLGVYLTQSALTLENINSSLSLVDNKLKADGNLDVFKNQVSFNLNTDMSSKDSSLKLSSKKIDLGKLPVKKAMQLAANGNTGFDLAAANLAEPEKLTLQGSISLDNASFRIPDYGVQLENISGQVKLDSKNISTPGLTAQIFGNKLKLSGNISDYQGKGELNFNLDADNFNITNDIMRMVKIFADLNKSDIMETLGSDFKLSGAVSLKTDLKGMLKNEKGSFEISINSLDMNDSTLRISVPKFYPQQLSIAAKCRIEKNACNISSLKLETPDGNLDVSGTVTNFSKPVLNLKIKSSQLVMEKLSSFIPKGYKPILDQYKPAGKVTLDFEVKGSLPPAGAKTGALKLPDYSGTVAVRDFSFIPPNFKNRLEIPKTDIVVSGRGVKIPQTTVKLLNSTATVSGDITDFRILNFIFQIPGYNLAELPQNFAFGGLNFTGEANATGSLKGDILDFLINADLKSDSLGIIYPKAPGENLLCPISELSAKCSFAYKTWLLHIRDLKFNTFKGTSVGEGTVEVNKTPIGYDFRVSLKDADVNDFLSLNTPLRNNILGTVSVDNSRISGSGSDIKTVTGKMDYQVSKGTIQSLPVLVKLSQMLSKYFKADFLEKITTSEFAGNVAIANGILSSQNSRIDSDMLAITTHGNMDLAWNMNAEAEITFKQKLIEQMKLTDKLGSKDFTFPFSIKGTLTAPDLNLAENLINISKKVAINAAVETGKKKLLDLLLKKNKKEEPQPTAPTTPTTTPSQPEPTTAPAPAQTATPQGTPAPQNTVPQQTSTAAQPQVPVPAATAETVSAPAQPAETVRPVEQPKNEPPAPAVPQPQPVNTVQSPEVPAAPAVPSATSEILLGTVETTVETTTETTIETSAQADAAATAEIKSSGEVKSGTL
ncbi:MAG: AsmA-like C-terminal region-containing protein [Candidatus Wallbacteria bacterium]|nr:AsmA-like C-terminal region-containing protein [Candidatus Wallbacteria bacterium]